MPSELPSIRRDQLRKFLPDERAVREFEKALELIQNVVANTADILALNDTVNTNTSDIAQNAADILTKADKNGDALELFSVKNGTTGNEAINYSQALGWGQTWQNVTASRASGTPYTNSTGKPIQVSVTVNPLASSTYTLMVGGVNVGYVSDDATNETQSYQLTAIVPSGSTYQLTLTGTGTLNLWTELR